LVHKIGIWQDGHFSWLDSGEWNIEIDLCKETFVGIMKCYHKNTNLELIFKNVVYNEKNIFIREVEVINHTEHVKNVKLFFHQTFSVYDMPQVGTAYYDPTRNTLVHYEGKTVFVVYGETSNIPFEDYTIGLHGVEGREGTYKDAEDGVLSKNPIEHGRIDSTLSIALTLHKQERKFAYYWITVGETKGEAFELHDYVKYRSPKPFIESTSKFWKAWLNRQDYLKCYITEDRQMELFKKSLFYMRGNIDNRGAVIASGDSDMLQHGRDTYSYMWPRDGALTVMTLLMVGEDNVSKHFFKFCNDVLEPDGYLMHKYRSDKALGSSWHPFVKDGKPILPIQEDETALVLVSLWDYYVTTKDIEFIDLHYYGFIKKMALFLAEFIDKDTGLPLPSYDLWEEKHGVSTFTASTVYAGLIAGSNFAELFEKNNTKEMLRSTAERMRLAIIEHLYDDSKGTFIKQISYRNNEVVHDTIVDSSSVYGIITYGVLPVTDKKVIASIQTLRERLQIHDGIGGVPRYERDQYYRQVDTPNPWYITTLWLAQYYIRKAENGDDLGEALRWINWTVEHSPHSGVLSEQLHPFTGEQLSATPLTWSHAEYVYTVQLYHQKLKDLGLCAPH
jgi:GH15 family glucan-1,4-alpha-glucosidase